MNALEERMAEHGVKIDRNEKDIHAIFVLLREHLEREEHTNAEIRNTIHSLDKGFISFKSEIKATIRTSLFFLSGVWAFVAFFIILFNKYL